jgi:hypothetical protein
MNIKSNSIGWVVAIVIAIIALFISIAAYGSKTVSQNPEPNYSADGDTNLTNLVLDGIPSTVGATFAATSYANATSTARVGCIDTLATSSATRIKLIFSTTGATSTFAGTTYWSYGFCP